jgi:hypothetical protein
MRSIALVVMEHGSLWPADINQWSVDVVAFGPPHGAPHERMRRACERAASEGRTPEFAVLACNAEADDEAIGRRVTLARSLVAAVLPGTSGRVILSAACNAASSLRSQLIALAGTLMESLRGGSASVSVHFDGGDSKEQLRGVLRPLANSSASRNVGARGSDPMGLGVYHFDTPVLFAPLRRAQPS